MRGIILHRARIVYWPIPKCACTSVMAHLANYLGLPGGTPHYPYDAAFEWTQAPIAGYRNVAIVRHPLSRLYSFWRNKIDTDSLDSHIPFPAAVRPRMPFPDLVRVIVAIAPAECDWHWAPQSEQVPEATVIFRFEEITPIFDLLGVQWLNASSPSEDWRQAFTPDSERAATAFYADDFARFGYAT